jgi:ribulose-phosphate 3-epimerase
MTVNPGWGGQKIIPSCVAKIAELKKVREEKKYNYLISCDGGINSNTVADVLNAGVDIVVSGSSFFTGKLDWKY